MTKRPHHDDDDGRDRARDAKPRRRRSVARRIAVIRAGRRVEITTPARETR